MALLSPVWLQRRRGGGFDSDALAYFARAGITNAIAKSQINNFVVGIKDLGIWNQSIYYPMRTSQNAGSGATVYSLGGLGIKNGTLSGSPAWSEDGIVFLQASSQGMTANTDGVATTSYNSIFVGDMQTAGGGGSCLIAQNGTLNADAFQINDSTSQISGGHRTVAGSTNVTLTPNYNYTVNVPIMVQQGWSTETNTAFRDVNGVAQASVAATAFGGFINPFVVNRRGDSAAYGFNKTCAFAGMVYDGGTTPAQQTAIFNLYLTTLGV